jgi:hypothetical protein
MTVEWLKAPVRKPWPGLLKFSWDEIHGIMERAVKRGLERRRAEPVSQIGVDPAKSWLTFLQNHREVNLLSANLKISDQFFTERVRSCNVRGEGSLWSWTDASY